MIKKMKKRAVTLVEMMIVMFLIAMITGVIAYNYAGSLEEGKAFKTRTGIEKLQTVIALYQAVHGADGVNWKEMVETSSLVKNPNDLMKDGWGVEYSVNMEGDHVIITSQKLIDYDTKKKK
jgi:general secretion pathway protein G